MFSHFFFGMIEVDDAQCLDPLINLLGPGDSILSIIPCKLCIVDSVRRHFTHLQFAY